MICSVTAQPLATSFLDYPLDMQLQAQQDEQQARKTAARARRGDTAYADTGLSASSEALLMSLAGHLKLTKS